eukprot:symbB.v1.2.017874.t1/scaffold1334.1/size124731/8
MLPCQCRCLPLVHHHGLQEDLWQRQFQLSAQPCHFIPGLDCHANFAAHCIVVIFDTMRQAPGTPVTSWRLCPAQQSPQVFSTSEQLKARRHSVPLQTTKDDVENQYRPIKTDASKIAMEQETRQHQPLSSISTRKSAETLGSCFANPARPATTTWTSPLMTSRLTRSTGSPLFSTPQIPQRTVRKSEALRFFPAPVPAKVAAGPSDLTHVATIDQVRAEMMKLLEERERCHQKQLTLMQDFQQAREREHQQQLQHMRDSHKADMQRLEEKLSQLVRHREGQAETSLSKSAQTLTESSAAVGVRGSTADEEEEEDTLLYTEPSLDHTLQGPEGSEGLRFRHQTDDYIEVTNCRSRCGLFARCRSRCRSKSIAERGQLPIFCCPGVREFSIRKNHQAAATTLSTGAHTAAEEPVKSDFVGCGGSTSSTRPLDPPPPAPNANRSSHTARSSGVEISKTPVLSTSVTRLGSSQCSQWQRWKNLYGLQLRAFEAWQWNQPPSPKDAQPGLQSGSRVEEFANRKSTGPNAQALHTGHKIHGWDGHQIVQAQRVFSFCRT